MHYLDHQSLDAANGIIVDVAVTPGNTTDATPYLDRIEYIASHVGLPVEAVGTDSAYDVSLVHRVLSDSGIRMYTPHNDEEPRYKAELKKGDFLYDEVKDSFICPAGKCLTVKQLQRFENNITREYRAERRDCAGCSLREKCLSPSQSSRRIQVNIFEGVVRMHHERDGRRSINAFWASVRSGVREPSRRRRHGTI